MKGENLTGTELSTPKKAIQGQVSHYNSQVSSYWSVCLTGSSVLPCPLAFLRASEEFQHFVPESSKRWLFTICFLRLSIGHCREVGLESNQQTVRPSILFARDAIPFPPINLGNTTYPLLEAGCLGVRQAEPKHGTSWPVIPLTELILTILGDEILS